MLVKISVSNIDAIFLIHNMRVGKRKKNKEHMV